MQRRFFSCREISEYLGLHEVTIRRLIDRGEIFAVKVGGSIKIDKIKLDEKLSSGLGIGK